MKFVRGLVIVLVHVFFFNQLFAMSERRVAQNANEQFDRLYHGEAGTARDSLARIAVFSRLLDAVAEGVSADRMKNFMQSAMGMFTHRDANNVLQLQALRKLFLAILSQEALADQQDQVRNALVGINKDLIPFALKEGDLIVLRFAGLAVTKKQQANTDTRGSFDLALEKDEGLRADQLFVLGGTARRRSGGGALCIGSKLELSALFFREGGLLTGVPVGNMVGVEKTEVRGNVEYAIRCVVPTDPAIKNLDALVVVSSDESDDVAGFPVLPGQAVCLKVGATAFIAARGNELRLNKGSGSSVTMQRLAPSEAAQLVNEAIDANCRAAAEEQSFALRVKAMAATATLIASMPGLAPGQTTFFEGLSKVVAERDRTDANSLKQLLAVCTQVAQLAISNDHRIDAENLARTIQDELGGLGLQYGDVVTLRLEGSYERVWTGGSSRFSKQHFLDVLASNVGQQSVQLAPQLVVLQAPDGQAVGPVKFGAQLMLCPLVAGLGRYQGLLEHNNRWWVNATKSFHGSDAYEVLVGSALVPQTQDGRQLFSLQPQGAEVGGGGVVASGGTVAIWSEQFKRQIAVHQGSILHDNAHGIVAVDQRALANAKAYLSNFIIEKADPTAVRNILNVEFNSRIARVASVQDLDQRLAALRELQTFLSISSWATGLMADRYAQDLLLLARESQSWQSAQTSQLAALINDAQQLKINPALMQKLSSAVDALRSAGEVAAAAQAQSGNNGSAPTFQEGVAAVADLPEDQQVSAYKQLMAQATTEDDRVKVLNAINQLRAKKIAEIQALEALEKSEQ